eukprot:1458452-Prymnesium_polylepis.2
MAQNDKTHEELHQRALLFMKQAAMGMSCDCLTDAVTGAVKAVEFSRGLTNCAVDCAYSSGACVRDTATHGRSRVARLLTTSARAAVMLRKSLSRRRRRGLDGDGAVPVMRRASTSRDTDTECGGDVGNQQLAKTVDEYIHLCMSSEWATVVDVSSMMEDLLRPYGGLGTVLLLRSIGSYIKALRGDSRWTQHTLALLLLLEWCVPVCDKHLREELASNLWLSRLVELAKNDTSEAQLVRATIAQLLANWAAWYDAFADGIWRLKKEGISVPTPELLAGSGPGAPRHAAQEQRVERTVLTVGFLQLDNQSLYASIPVVLAPLVMETEEADARTLHFELERCPDLGQALNLEYITKLHVDLEPLSLQLEDTLLLGVIHCIAEVVDTIEEVTERQEVMATGLLPPLEEGSEISSSEGPITDQGECSHRFAPHLSLIHISEPTRRS